MITLLRNLRHGPLNFLSPLWVALGSVFRWAIAGLNLTTSQHIGAYGPFRLDGRFAFSNFKRWGEGHNDSFAACVEACRGRRVVLDIGAHIGLVSLPVASILVDDGLLVAFEPATANAALLDRHIYLNNLSQKVRIENTLVGEEDRDDVPFFELCDATGMNTVVPYAMGGDYRPVSRSQITLDTYCSDHDLTPEVIKIDVEGAELGVLRGGRETLSRCRPTIFLSVHPRQIALLGEAVDALFDLIESLDYVCRHADGTAVTEFRLREYVLTPRQEHP